MAVSSPYSFDSHWVGLMGIHETSALRRSTSLEGSGSVGTITEQSRKLRSLASDLLVMAREIEAGTTRSSPPMSGERIRPAREMTDKAALLERAAQKYVNRRLRHRFFPAELFGESAWDLLLDLFQARLEDKMITVTSACIAADVPVSTALRWIGLLEQHGLVERSRNVSDQRSTWVRLTDRAAAAMIEYTDSCLTRSRRADRLADEHRFARMESEAA